MSKNYEDMIVKATSFKQEEPASVWNFIFRPALATGMLSILVVVAAYTFVTPSEELSLEEELTYFNIANDYMLFEEEGF